MTLTYFNDVNVYFHMRNHYRMLKNVKSVVDTSIPESFQKAPVAMHNSEKRFNGGTNERLRKIYKSSVHSPKRGSIKQHSCLNSDVKSEASLKTASPYTRPGTRRNLLLTPRETLPPRSSSVGPPTKNENMFRFRQKKRPSISSTRSLNSEAREINLQLDLDKESTKSSLQSPASTKISPCQKNSKYISPKASPKTVKSAFFKESSEEHEYLLFLLRITEDIIVNDFYTNKDIKQVFRFHIEANKERLNVRKMQYHISNLCKELNIDFKEYQTDDADEVDDPGKFKTSPLPRNFYMNNEAFLNCHDCSTLRKSSLYDISSSIKEQNISNVPLLEYDDDSSLISPSLLKLLDKLSLGRVTECTEPVASTSTVNSPKIYHPNTFGKEDDKANEHVSNSPTDFDTFVKELNSRDELPNNAEMSERKFNSTKKELITSESPPMMIYTTLAHLEKSDLSKSTSKSIKSSSEHSLVYVKQSKRGSKSDTDISIKNTKSLSHSEKYDSEFEKVSSSSKIRDSGDEAAADRIEKSERDDSDDHSSLNRNSSKEIILDTVGDISDVSSQTNVPKQVPLDSRAREADINVQESEGNFSQSDDAKVEKSEANETSFIVQTSKSNEPKTGTSRAQLASEKPDSLLKVILPESINSDDYVMIKGPVYIYKPLLDSEPRLVVINDNNADINSRRNSVDSQHSNRTFTVDNEQEQLPTSRTQVDEAVQCDSSVHSVHVEASIDNILELTRQAYSQFNDITLLNSDYDLTPEKDPDNKYHHLMVDVSTSISGASISEDFLLKTDYSEEKVTKQPFHSVSSVTDEKINTYLNLPSRLRDNVNSNNTRESISFSESISNLKLGQKGKTTDNIESDEVKTAETLSKRSSDLIQFNVPSQESLIRSECEVHSSLQI